MARTLRPELPLPRGYAARVGFAAMRALSEMRYAAGLTQADVAERTGIHRPIVGRIERGVHVPTLETCEAFARACGRTVLDVTRAVDEALHWAP